MTFGVATRERVLSEAEWTARQDAHEERVDGWITPHLERTRRAEKHPVEDFLFTYYSYAPKRLRRWHPGFGVILEGLRAEEHFASTLPEASIGRFLPYEKIKAGVRLKPEMITQRRDAIEWIRELLAATADRPAHFGCLGLHEWAMVYRQPETEVRHRQVPLRLGAKGTDEVVEGHRIKCSHFDAYRFFTDEARPRNQLLPTRETQAQQEQGGCLHANMDLYKWAYKLGPLVPAELIADCFELAREIRTLDMRASPYDLRSFGYEAVRIETTEGKAEYAAAQRSFADRARPLRQRLIDECDRLL